MNLKILEDADWTADDKRDILNFISVPAYNGGHELPEGASLADVFEQIKTRSLGIWADGLPTLCLSIAPIDDQRMTGLFHAAGDRRLPFGVVEKVSKAWLGKLAQGGYSVRAFTSIKAVARAARRIGFEDWGHDPQTGDWVGAFRLHN